MVAQEDGARDCCGGLVAVLAGAGWFYRSRTGGGETIDSVAVLPFVNASADPNAEYLSDGITESLINSLSQLPHLKVMSRDSAFPLQGQGHGCPDSWARARAFELSLRAESCSAATVWPSAPN